LDWYGESGECTESHWKRREQRARLDGGEVLWGGATSPFPPVKESMGNAVRGDFPAF